jgi:peptide deformylase
MNTLVPYTDKILHKPSSPFDFEIGMSSDDLSERLFSFIKTKKAYGLAAPQIGINARVFVFLDEVVFNPEVVEVSQTEVTFTEGCLSYPNLWVSLKRPHMIKARYFDAKGNEIIRELNDLETRVYLHELDHLNGITMVDRASDFKLKRAIEHANKHGSSYKYAVLRKV